MSEAQTTQQPTPQEAPAPVPDNDDPTTPLQAPGEAPNGEEPKPEPEEERKRSERRSETQRIAYLNKQRYAERARAEAAEQAVRELQARLNPGAPQQPTPQDFEQAVDRRAEEKLAQAEHDKRFREWDVAGRKEFGEERFLEACRTVSDMAAPEQRGMLTAIALDSEGGQKAIIELSENPAEAERILGLPPHRMALALAKLGEPKAAAEALKPVSGAPSPIRPPAGGRARGAADPNNGDFSSYTRWSADQKWRR